MDVILLVVLYLTLVLFATLLISLACSGFLGLWFQGSLMPLLMNTLRYMRPRAAQWPIETDPDRQQWSVWVQLHAGKEVPRWVAYVMDCHKCLTFHFHWVCYISALLSAMLITAVPIVLVSALLMDPESLEFLPVGPLTLAEWLAQLFRLEILLAALLMAAPAVPWIGSYLTSLFYVRSR